MALVRALIASESGWEPSSVSFRSQPPQDASDATMIALHSGCPLPSSSGVVGQVDAVVMPGGGEPLICVASMPCGSSTTYGGDEAVGVEDWLFEYARFRAETAWSAPRSRMSTGRSEPART